MRHFTFDDAAVVLAGAQAARQYFEPIFLEREQELAIVALCDSKVRLNQLLSFPGSVESCSVSLADVIRHSLYSDALIIAHNHPSGNPRPSESDIRFTRKLCQLSDAIDLTVLDHLIFGRGEMFSFRQAGLI